MSQSNPNRQRIPLVSGNEVDGLSRRHQRHSFARGERRRIKRGYQRRLRQAMQREIAL